MGPFETPPVPEKYTPDDSSAERRRARAEKKEEVSISHWKGDLHTHTRTDVSNPETPDNIIENRKGSNCGKVPLEVLAEYHASEMKNEFLAITEHSRDADPEKALEGITNWFSSMYLNNDGFIKEKFGKSRKNLNDSDLEELHELAVKRAKLVANYGDERLEQIQDDIEQVNDELPIHLIKGIEANLKPDGTYDTNMVDEGKFELVNCSIHPDLDPEGYAPIIANPEKYTDLIIKGIQHPKTNIMAHIGYNAPQELTEELDWDKISKEATEHKVALEINLRKVMKFLYREILDFEKNPKDDTSYINLFKSKLPELVPIVSNPAIRSQLKPYVENGLMFAINTDEHENPHIDVEVTEDSVTAKMNKREFRYWRCMKILEGYFNNVFDEMGIQNNNILNTLNNEERETFLQKK